MKLTATLNQSNFKKKVNNLRNLNYMFAQLAEHVCMFVMHQMRDQELNRPDNAKGPGSREMPVRNISGDLRLSADVQSSPYAAVLRMNPSQASYGRMVADKVKKRHGSNYMELTWLRIGEAVLSAIQEEWHRAVSIIERGGNYVYNNPFYTAI